MQRFWADAPSPRPGWGPRIVFGCRRCRLGAPGVFAVLETLKLVALPCPPDALTRRTLPSPQPFYSDPVPALSSHRGPRTSSHRLPGPPCRGFGGYRPGTRYGRQGAAERRGAAPEGRRSSRNGLSRPPSPRETPGPPPPWRSASSSGWRTASRSWSSSSGSGCSRERRSGEAGGGPRRRRDVVPGEGPRTRAARPVLLRWLISPPRRAVLRKASALEYKIQRRTLRKEDFINYIQVGFID